MQFILHYLPNLLIYIFCVYHMVRFRIMIPVGFRGDKDVLSAVNLCQTGKTEPGFLRVPGLAAQNIVIADTGVVHGLKHGVIKVNPSGCSFVGGTL